LLFFFLISAGGPSIFSGSLKSQKYISMLHTE
jgi:hypothetical protein